MLGVRTAEVEAVSDFCLVDNLAVQAWSSSMVLLRAFESDAKSLTECFLMFCMQQGQSEEVGVGGLCSITFRWDGHAMVSHVSRLVLMLNGLQLSQRSS